MAGKHQQILNVHLKSTVLSQSIMTPIISTCDTDTNSRDASKN